MIQKKYRGVVVPMVTPVTKEGKLDIEAVVRIIEFFAKAGVSPLLMGTTGEGNSVSPKDGLLFVETAVKAAQKRITIYAGLTGNCFSEQLVQAEAYTKAGADVIVATLPTYYALTPEQMENYYRTLADSIKGPLMLYNILATTHMSIPVDVIRRLADHPNIVGLKDSERDLERMAQCIEIAKIYQKDRTLGQSLTALKVMMQTKGLCEPWMLMPLTRLSAEEEKAIAAKATALS